MWYIVDIRKKGGRKMAIPKYDELFNPLLKVMRNLGGSASIPEQETEVIRILNISEKEASVIHRGNRTKLGYRLAWARNYLKRYGLLENSSRGVWALTLQGNKTTHVDKNEVNRYVKRIDETEGKKEIDVLGIEKDKAKPGWEDELLNVVKKITPDAFEKLCKRLLRESGFIQVEVTGKSGDGGIDGKGVVKIGGLLSFHVIFQCKRYQKSVSPSVIRDFRGAMVGRADKGLIITTGIFTRNARAEAQRDGAAPVDLIDGEELVQKLKDLRIGVEVKEEITEGIEIQKEWFENL